MIFGVQPPMVCLVEVRIHRLARISMHAYTLADVHLNRKISTALASSVELEGARIASSRTLQRAVIF